MSNTGQAKGTPVPRHRDGIGAGDSESVIMPKEFGRISEWFNKHIRSLHAEGPFGAGALFPPDYIVASEWAAEVAAGRGTEGQSVYTYQKKLVKLYSTIQGAVDAWVSAGTSKSIFIAPGTYTEDVVVVVAGAAQHITIEGFGGTTVIIEAYYGAFTTVIKGSGLTTRTTQHNIMMTIFVIRLADNAQKVSLIT